MFGSGRFFFLSACSFSPPHLLFSYATNLTWIPLYTPGFRVENVLRSLPDYTHWSNRQSSRSRYRNNNEISECDVVMYSFQIDFKTDKLDSVIRVSWLPSHTTQYFYNAFGMNRMNRLNTLRIWCISVVIYRNGKVDNIILILSIYALNYWMNNEMLFYLT